MRTQAQHDQLRMAREALSGMQAADVQQVMLEAAEHFDAEWIEDTSNKMGRLALNPRLRKMAGWS